MYGTVSRFVQNLNRLTSFRGSILLLVIAIHRFGHFLVLFGRVRSSAFLNQLCQRMVWIHSSNRLRRKRTVVWECRKRSGAKAERKMTAIGICFSYICWWDRVLVWQLWTLFHGTLPGSEFSRWKDEHNSLRFQLVLSTKGSYWLWMKRESYVSVATSTVVLRWFCDSPRTGCVWRITPLYM